MANDVEKLIVKRIKKIDDQIDDLPYGSEEHARMVDELLKMSQGYAQVKNSRITEEDNIAKREEQKRVNDQELKNKDYQMVMEADRLEAERQFKAQQLKLNLLNIAMNGILGFTGETGKFMYTHMAMKSEGYLSNGESFLPSRNVMSAIDRFDKKNKTI